MIPALRHIRSAAASRLELKPAPGRLGEVASIIQSLNIARLALLFALLLLAPGLAAQARSPEEAERVYREVGDQLNCVCGSCRDKLLECSHNRCEAKDAQRYFLRMLSRDDTQDAASIRSAMAARFGERALQVPPQSNMFTVLALALTALAAAFGGMFWYLAGRRRAQAQGAGAAPAHDELDARIERDMQELS